MATHEIRLKYDGSGPTAFSKALASLASSAVGVGRQTNMVAVPTGRSAAIISGQIKTGTTPTSGKVIRLYQLNGDGAATPKRTNNAATAESAITILNAPVLETITVDATSNKAYEFCVVVYGLALEIGIAVVHDTVAALNATEADQIIQYRFFCPEIQ